MIVGLVFLGIALLLFAGTRGRSDRHPTYNLVRKYWSKNEITRLYWGGWQITTRLGEEVRIKPDGSLEAIYGGSEHYRKIILFAAELRRIVKVSGPSEHILAMIAHGENENIDVMPLGQATPGFVIAFQGLVVSLFAGVVASRFVDFYLAVGVGVLTFALACRSMSLNDKALRRRKGQGYRNPFPIIYRKRH